MKTPNEMKVNKSKDEALREILLGIYRNLENLMISPNGKRWPNERYLHHYFSHQVQIQKLYCLNGKDPFNGTFHPEWATKGKYRNYEYNKDGESGNIDFTLGDYDKPEYGIEFKQTPGWNSKATSFDYMKLLDRENTIEKAISVAVIFREKELNDEIERINISKIKTNRLNSTRPFLFWIIEVSRQDIHSWYCNNLKKGFNSLNRLEDLPWFYVQNISAK